MNPTPSPARPALARPFRWLPYLAGGALIVILLISLRPHPAPVETALATVGSLRSTVSEEGKTRIRQRYIVSSPVNGQLQRVPFKPGAEVVAGETIVAEIAPLAATPLDARAWRLAEVRRDAAAASLEKTRLAHDLAMNDLKRLEQMFAEKTVSPQTLESGQVREAVAARYVIAAVGSLRQIEAELAGATAPGNPTTPIGVRAPISGRVLRVFQESERPVSAGTPLLEIGDPIDIEVVIELLSRDAAALAPGAKVEFEQWGGTAPLAGRVRQVEPAAFTKISALGVEEQRVNVVADITTPFVERSALGDNFRVEARVVTWESENVLKIPVSALFRRGADWATYVVRDDKARLLPVKVGRSSATERQILDGLKTGDQVILYPGDRISDGQRVTTVKL